MSQESLLVIFGGAVVSTLVGSVAFLFTLHQKDFDDLKKRCEECEADREHLWRELADIKIRLGEMD